MGEEANKGRGVLLVLLAATVWGTLGTLYKYAEATFGLTSLTIVFWRATFAALGIFLLVGVSFPLTGRGLSAMWVHRTDLGLFTAFGLLGVTAFFLLYAYAVALVGVAVAVVLLYTSPLFVAIMAWRVLGEVFGWRKVVALVATLAGCVLVARLFDSGVQVDALGILCGLGSGFTYALYSILGKQSLKRGYSITTLSLYVYGIGALGLLVVALFVGPEQLFVMEADPGAWGLLVMLAVVPTLGALTLYVSGLRHLEAGVASIVATIEPVVATLLAFFVVREPLSGPQLLGGALIMGAVLVLSVPGKKT